MLREKKVQVGFFLIFAILFAAGIFWSRTKLTYLEYTTFNDTPSSFVRVENTQTVLRQKIVMPYGRFSGLGLLLGTGGQDNNSVWTAALYDENGKLLHRWQFNAGEAENDAFYRLKMTRALAVDKGGSYELALQARTVSDDTALSFYYADGVYEAEHIPLYVDGTPIGASLSLQVYGGEYDGWWTGFYCLVCGLLCIAVGVCLWRNDSFQQMKRDPVFVSAVLAFLLLAMLCLFARADFFTDENDNFRGEMLIANGAVLYRDYVTQHTPFVYYLCAVFAKLGAASVEQFRLSYYLLYAVICGLLYGRYQAVFGRVKMFLFPIMMTALSVALSSSGARILSDNVQGLCMCVLLLEFCFYLKERRLTWGRIAIAACCVWGGIGAAFLSVYPVFVVFIGLILVEIGEWRKRKGQIGFGAMGRRWGRLILGMTVLPAIPLLYFGFHGALRTAYEMAFQFNMQVYPFYEGGYGANKLQPVLEGIENYFNALIELPRLIGGGLTQVQFLQFLIVALLTVIFLRLAQKGKGGLAVFLFFFLVLNSTRNRGNDSFHTLPFWQVGCLILVLCGELLVLQNRKRETKAAAAFLAVYLAGLFLTAGFEPALSVQQPVTQTEATTVAVTEEGERIFIDTVSVDSLYLLYKNRYPVNRLTYLLPWYMDWYEEQTIQDLETASPRIALFNPSNNVWGFTRFSNGLEAVLRERYSQFAIDPAKEGYQIWIRKDNES